ncbi:MAG: geranyl transferase [Gemmataceae bacterium]|nr:geranyl transferase [Gemmataceae bacterium]
MTDSFHGRMASYFEDLNRILARGVSLLPKELRQRHAGYLTSQQNPDGGFRGRDDGSDLYYTGFALRGLALLDALTIDVCTRAADFLTSCSSGQASVVDFYSFLLAAHLVRGGGGPDVLARGPADWVRRVAETLAHFRTPDGGYNKNPGAAAGSTYHTFLVGLCLDLLDLRFPQPDDVRAFVLGRRRPDGGFVEVAPMRNSGTNPTAAAIGILRLLDPSFPNPASSFGDWQSTIDFLADLTSLEGGLRANARVPVADLLSTFTGAWTLAQFGALDRAVPRQLQAFAEALQDPDGGFRGGLWDEAADVEYTFYGLATLALTANHQD